MVAKDGTTGFAVGISPIQPRPSTPVPLLKFTFRQPPRHVDQSFRSDADQNGAKRRRTLLV